MPRGDPRLLAAVDVEALVAALDTRPDVMPVGDCEVMQVGSRRYLWFQLSLGDGLS